MIIYKDGKLYDNAVLISKEDLMNKITGLMDEVSIIEKAKEELPKPKTEPDQECLDTWNELNIDSNEAIELQARLNKTQEELTNLMNIK